MNLPVIRLAILAAMLAAPAVAQQVPKALENPQPYDFAYFFRSNISHNARWWVRPDTVKSLGLSAEQQKTMDAILQQHRLKLIDVEAALEREEVMLEPLVAADPPDDAKVLAQIDRVAQARAELEKANSRMLWQVRRVLTAEQWKRLQGRTGFTLQPK